MTQYRPINSLLKGLKILEVLAFPHVMLSFQELTLETGMPKATVFRFLKTLVPHNYISFDPKSKKYFIGPRVMSFGYAAFSGLELKEIALPYLNQLSRASDQNVNLAILERVEIVYVECLQKWDLVKLNLFPGSRLNSYQTSSGRSILAFLSHDKFQSVVSELLKIPEALKCIGRRGEKLLKMLEDVRTQGYAINDEEFTKGVRSIAAPIFNREGEVEAAINMPVFSYRVSRKELIKKYLPMLLETAEKISTVRGFIKPRESSIENGNNRLRNPFKER
jgi:IclR family transcriptional regulator, pca regulon regulatory protein